MTDERSIERQNGSFCETILWNARDKLDPPYKGYVMFASSCPDTNVPHLLEVGYSAEEIVIVEYDNGNHETIWIPNLDGAAWLSNLGSVE
tara:strand:- start:82 stop:351 length:270 start_codon:yes stop_codon:yes gene_type:complete